MKRILTLFFLAIVSLGVRAQVLFYQDFESGDIAPMTAVDVDGKTVDPNVSGIAGPTFQPYQLGDGNWAAVSTSWFSPPGQADDWLISPPIAITDANTFLSWRSFTPDASFRDGYQVRISTTDNAIASFSTLALNVAAELTTWNDRNVKLGAYVGDTIYFAFRNNSNDKFLLYMDNIKVEVLPKNDIIVRSLNIDKYIDANNPLPINISIQNHGADPLTSFAFTYNIGGYDYVDTIKNLNLAPLKNLDVSSSLEYTFSTTGKFPISVYTSAPNGLSDADSTDNGANFTIYGATTPVPKKVFVEEATGTWCQWCPRGAVYMDLIAAQFGDILMPVSVHNYDPMVVPDYDTPFSSSVGGYPSSHVDRKFLDINPDQLPDTIPDIQNRLVPVAVKTEVTWDPVNRMATIKGTSHLTISTPSNELRYMCVITEDDVRGTDSGYDQSNAYSGGAAGPMGGFEELPNPVPASQMVYNFVARALFGGFNGMENSVPETLAADEDFQVEYNYSVPAEYDVTKMKAIIVVLDEETGEVLNGDIVPLGETTSVPLVPAGHFTAYPNPTTDILNLQVDYATDAKVTMRVYTPMGQLVRDMGNLDLSNGKQTAQLNVADLCNGNYILELRNKNSVTALPFTKM